MNHQPLTINYEPSTVNRFGPHRTSPDSGTSRHAYSPFDKREEPPPRAEFVPGQVLVKLKPEALTPGPQNEGLKLSPPVQNRLFAEHGVISMEQLFPSAHRFKAFLTQNHSPSPGRRETEGRANLERWFKAKLSEGANVPQVVEALNEDPSVQIAEPDYLRRPVSGLAQWGFEPTQARPMALPDGTTDPLYDQQWHLGAANVPAAWQFLENKGINPGGSRDVVVAILDTGVDYTHPDLVGNMWINSGEIPDNGVDDDGNGYIDDIHGADVVAGDGDPQDDHGHGTHVAGIACAQGNNGIGGVGVAYNTQIMAIKAAQYSGVLATSDIAEGILYAVDKGADVINMSFGGYFQSQIEEDALAVAFGSAVLVAAAGNDARNNEVICRIPAKAMYPAAYPWILGVMASAQSPNADGDWLTSFSNRDVIAENSIEYNLMAPGAGILSALPGDQYAAWSGTSMSAPVVSGIAALVRSYYSDKDMYSSRFIMGQIAPTGPSLQGYSPPCLPPISYHLADAHAALSSTPQPSLTYLNHWLFDEESLNASNDDDGRVDSGETVDLAITIRNHWGKADNVQVTLRAWNGVSAEDDPYVTLDIPTVDYGAVGSFNIDDNGLIYDAEGEITGINHPFRFTVSPDCPNDHIIPFLLTMTCVNGFKPEDNYTFTSRFELVVQRGVELPRFISEDMTLTGENYYVVPDATLVNEGVTLTIEHGTQIQFWSSDPEDPYSTQPHAKIVVAGTLLARGTAEDPVRMFPSSLHPDRFVMIQADSDGVIDLQYARVTNPYIEGAAVVDHCYFDQLMERLHFWRSASEFWTDQWSAKVQSNFISYSLFHGIGPYVSGFNGWRWGPISLDHSQNVKYSLFDSSICKIETEKFYGNVLLKNYKPCTTMCSYEWRGSSLIKDWGPVVDSPTNPNTPLFRNNAILNLWRDPNVDHWLSVEVSQTGGIASSEYVFIDSNYWGTQSKTLIDASIKDFYDDFTRPRVIYEPILTDPPEDCYPFVTDVVLSIEGDPDATTVGAEPVTFTVTFNRDMDTTVPPQVSFGPDVPETDYTVHPVAGGWQDARTWQGTFNITPVTGDGYQFIRVAGAVAADDPWLVTGDDSGRFRFEVITSGTEAMNLQATGGEGFVDLMWTQDDFDLLAGFNLYRATSQDGTYTRLNESIIPPDVRIYRNTDVQPGQPYYYKFTVVKTDMTESDFSNVATATPVDTILPAITHTPITTAAPGLPLTISADVTDNVGVQGVTLYYRAIGAPDYLNKEMVNTSGDRYSATLEGSLMTSPGVEYYIEATDGVGIQRDGRREFPHQIAVEDRPVVTAVTPDHGPTAGGTAVTISGSNFKDGASVTFGGAAADDVVRLSESQITCTTPPHFPETVDVIVTNPDDQSGTLLRAFTYESDIASLSLPDTSGGQNAIVQIPVNIANVQGLAAASLTVTFDGSVLSAQGAGTGNLTPGWSLAANTDILGEVRLSMAAPGGTVSGSGTLVLLEFEVIGSPGTSSALRLTDVSLNDSAIPTETADASFSVDLVYSVSGTVRFWNGGEGVPGTLLTLDGDRIYTDVSDEDGVYSVTGVPAGDYTLTPGKSDRVDGISAYDASLVLQHDAGLITLSGSAAIAGDVNKSGSITSMDAFYILQKAVDLITLPFTGAGVVWDFTPASRSYTNLNSNPTSQDFTAILLGDVSGNWSSEAGTQGTGHQPSPSKGEGMGESETSSAALALPQVRTVPSGQVTVPLKLEIEQAQLYGADIVLAYDPAVASAVSVEQGALADAFSMAVNLNQPGQIRIAMAGAEPIGTNGELLSINFDLTGNSGIKSPLEILSADFNEGAISTELHNGELTVAIPGDVDLDNTVDAADLSTVADNFNQTGLNPADLNGDGIVDIFDLVGVGGNFGQTGE